MILALSVALTLVTGQFAPRQAGSEPLPPDQEARVQKLGKELRCAVCQGLAITDSPASMARAQLDKVRELVKEGRSDEEIKQYFVARYGEWVLLRPPTTGAGTVVWVAPVLVVLFGGLGIAFYFWSNRRASKPKVEAKPAVTASAGGSEDPYLKAIQTEADQ